MKKLPPLPPGREPVLVDGVRTPFLKSNGAYKELMAYELGAHAIRGLVAKSGVDPKDVELVTMGTVVQDPRTSNLARESMLAAGLPHSTPAITTTLACISANVAATSACDAIMLGRVDVAIAGGAESLSDPPIRLSKNLRQALVKSQKAKGPAGYLEILKELSPEDLIPDVPSAAEFSTGLTMGQSCERFAKRVGVTREEADAFAARSHVLADRAWKEGRYASEVSPVPLTPSFELVKQDDGPRGDSTPESLAKLKPAFDREFGLITAGSSSFLTDGASAVLLMSKERADKEKKKVRAIVRDYVYAAGDPLEELLAGPALSVPVLLEKTGLKASDIGVWEIHEAFASQVVANLRVMKEQHKIEIPLERINAWGGSLSIGHPFGATGGRLLTTAAHRLEVTGARYAIVTGCAAGGHGSAILLENPLASN
jgi:acetyl-CoA acetyltransferase family protein